MSSPCFAFGITESPESAEFNRAILFLTLYTRKFSTAEKMGNIFKDRVSVIAY